MKHLQADMQYKYVEDYDEQEEDCKIAHRKVSGPWSQGSRVQGSLNGIFLLSLCNKSGPFKKGFPLFINYMTFINSNYKLDFYFWVIFCG